MRLWKLPVWLLLLAAGAQPSIACAAAVPEALQRFEAERTADAAALARQVASCVVRQDNSYPALHGCVDWHSATHGAWALSAYARISGDRQYDALLATMLSPENLTAEQTYLLANPDFEMPYGRAWFLRLAVERSKLGRDAVMDAMAAQVAQSLMEFLGGRRINLETQEYANVTWPLLNLLDYGKSTHDETVRRFVETIVRRDYLTYARACPIGKEKDQWAGFMAICTTAAWLVAETVPKAEFDVWIGHFLPPGSDFDPVMRPASDHQAGLDFSRSWGFWELYRHTGDTRYLDAFVANFDANMRHRDWWAGEYRRVGHWVAQFGMVAITLTVDDLP